MTSVFISYSSKDSNLAKPIYSALTSFGVDTFLAEISIKPGMNWTKEIFNALRTSNWVFFIATKAACASQAVQQELGASIIQKKQLIPVLVDISPEELPGWVGKHQAIDLRKGRGQLDHTIQEIVHKVNRDKKWGLVILVAIIVALLGSIGD